MPIVNGHSAEPGCYIDGHHGQYAPDRLADLAESFGCTIPERFDPRAIRASIEHMTGDTADAWMLYHEAADLVLDWLNDRTDDDHLWEWVDGELYLSAMSDVID
jgi:hypothetical protein